MIAILMSDSANFTGYSACRGVIMWSVGVRVPALRPTEYPVQLDRLSAVGREGNAIAYSTDSRKRMSYVGEADYAG